MSMVPDRPCPTSAASGVLYRVTPAISSDGYWSNSTLRLSPVLTSSRPLSSVVAKSGDRPRTLITWARPATRCAAMPGSRARDSAMLTSGSLPMSSAEMASTIEVASFLMSIARSMPPRMPVTVTLSRVLASSAFFFAALSSVCAVSVADCACAWAAIIIVADASATLSRFRFNCTIFPSRSRCMDEWSSPLVPVSPRGTRSAAWADWMVVGRFRNARSCIRIHRIHSGKTASCTPRTGFCLAASRQSRVPSRPFKACCGSAARNSASRTQPPTGTKRTAAPPPPASHSDSTSPRATVFCSRTKRKRASPRQSAPSPSR